jgi:hypothetical protein
MRRFCFLAVVFCLALAGQTWAVDLAKIDRSLRKEPTYQSKQPRYCLMVFGPEAKTRVWVVLDGDVLYLDRNGNGDLTDPGERITSEEVYRNHPERPDVEVMRRFELNRLKAGGGPLLPCSPEVEWFQVVQLVPRADWHDQAWVKLQQEQPDDFVVNTKTGRAQRAKFRFASSPQEAPILLFDGPRRFALSGTFDQPRFRPGESCELAVELHTQGWNATVRTELPGVPEDVHPVAEIEFPPGRLGKAPTRVRVELKERC